MTGHILITIFVAIFAVIVPSASGNACADVKGTGKIFIPNPTLCSAYIICENSNVVRGGTCGTYSAFIGKSCQPGGKCDPTPLTNICVGKDDNEEVPSPVNCKDYYYCLDGAGYLETCATGKKYDATAKGCVSNPGNVCTSVPTSENICEDQPPGKFMPSSDNCYEYYVCTGTKEGKLGACTSDYLFDPTNGRCVYPHDYVCPIVGGGRPITIPEPPTLNPGEICGGLPYDEAGFAKDPNSCTGYYYCARGAMTTTTPEKGVCPNNFYFDGEKCVPPYDFYCQIPPCQGQPIGKFVSDPSTCNGYFYCDGTNEAGNPEFCPEGFHFDEFNQNCNVASVVKCDNSFRTRTADSSPTEKPPAAGKKTIL